MKVLFINPPYGMLPTGDKIPSPPGCFPPLGLCYMAAVLEQNDIEVKILDADVLEYGMQEIIEYVEKERPDFVGLTSVTVTRNTALRIIEEIKKRHPEIISIIGGPHVHFLWEETLQNKFVDFCVIGEGEYVVLNLVKALGENKSFKNIEGLAFRSNGKIVSTGPSQRITKLDDLPLPARHLLPMEEYKSPFLVKVGGKPYTALMTSRGCPFRCKYCASSAMWNGRATYHSPEKVIEELVSVKEEFGIKYFTFSDDTFTVIKKRVDKICDGILENNLDMDWACLVRADTIDADVLKKMKSAGCKGVYMGIEFGNQRLLDFVDKRIDLKMVRDAVNLINRVGGLKLEGVFMIGYPTETRETINDTINFAKSLDLTAAAFSITVPYPGTELQTYCKENNLLINEDWSKYSPKKGETFIKLEDIDQNEISELLVKANREFYLRPKYIIKSLSNIRTLADLKYYTSQAAMML
jgi:radical SAM superfamily enzyme YgiQ (UPF0313 family)